MSTKISHFGTYPDGREILLYTISNSKGMEVSVTDIGAALVSVLLPDGKGGKTDVVLGFDKGEAYLGNPSFFGTVIGPSANRTGGAAFTLDGIQYRLDANDGPNNLHSHKDKGYHKMLWKAIPGENGVCFALDDPDGNMGFPGNKKVSVTYILDEQNTLTLHYHGNSDRRTVLNLTNHSYFNLNSHDSGTITGHTLWLGASRYTIVAEGSIPTGELAAVEGTPMDFRAAREVGRDIDADTEQLRITGGYDHNWVIDGWDGTLRHFATVTAPGTGRTMKAYTTLPGVQFYAGNFIEDQEGKGGAQYGFRTGLCLETQYFPDTVNHPAFPSCIFGDGTAYDSVTAYEFVLENPGSKS